MEPVRRRRWIAAVAVVALTAVVATLGVLGLHYRRQIVSYLTHRKGGPTHTGPYVPLAEDDPPLLRIAVAGDAGDSGRRLDATGSEIDAIETPTLPFTYLLLLGDNVYPDGDPARLGETVFAPFAGVLDGTTELLAVVGNHDAGHADDQLAALGMPGRWWSVEREGVLLVGLDSTRSDDPVQRAWLEATLRSSTARWRIVALHHPPYSAGYQGSSDEARAAFTPLFERYGVQLVLSGHDHDYQRSVPIDGVTYVVSGAASGTRRTGEDAFTAVSWSWRSFVELAVYPDRILGRAVGSDLRVADEWTLTSEGGSDGHPA